MSKKTKQEKQDVKKAKEKQSETISIKEKFLKDKKIPEEVSQEILKKVFINLLKAILIMGYFIILNMAYTSMKHERLIEDIKVFSGIFLIVGIIFLEKAYKKEKTSFAIDGIELICLSIHSLSIMHIIALYDYDFRIYLLASSYIFSTYYVFKAIFLYTKGRKQYLNSLNDISEIVKKEEPIKKEAKKRTTTKDKKTTKKQKNDIADKKETPKKTKTKTKSNTDKENTEDKQIKKRGRPKKEVKEND